jgi:protein O-GlcNAc transferase
MSHAKAQALLQQALMHHQAGRLPSAAALYAQVRALAPTNFDGHHLGGVAALQQGLALEGAELLGRAIKLSPRSAASHMCLGLAFATLGRMADAEQSLRRATELDPKNHEAWSNLASLHATAGRLEDAVAAYRRAVEIKPSFAQGWTGLGSILQLQGKSEEAIEHHTRALKLDPQHPKARLARAQSLQSCHRIAESLADFEGHLARHPDDLEARSYRLLLLNYLPDLPREKVFAEHLDFGRHASKAARNAASHARAPGHLESKIGNPKSKIRVAFLSPDLRAHSVAAFIEPILQHLDRTQFDVFLYHDHFRCDEVSARLQSLATVWRNFVGFTPELTEAQIRADAPDILIDLAGHTGFNRLPLFARRLAPVQISYLGYPNTTGLAEMDYRFTDEIADPPGESDACHSETLVRFAPTAWAYSPAGDAPPVSPPPSSLGRPFTFGSFNSLSKVNEVTLQLWSTVLQATPGSRLLLKSFGLSPGALTPRLLAAGIDPQRVDLLPGAATTREHLACYERMDVALDPFPYHGTTTTCEALWMGVPVITMCGDRHASRVGASLLRAIGRGDLVASDTAGYVAIARRLQTDVAGLAEFRRNARALMSESPLLQHQAQAARFGAALRTCWLEKSASASPPAAAARELSPATPGR